jgi:hypothetical protein
MMAKSYHILQLLARALFLLLLPMYLSTVIGSSIPDFASLVSTLRGDDTRLVRWDATEHTRTQQSDENICGKEVFDKALDLIVVQNSISNDKFNLKLIALASDYITLCVTDNPNNRALFAAFPGIHDSVIGLIDKTSTKIDTKTDKFHRNSKALSKLAHVMYITTYANTDNHQAYINKGAAMKLSKIIKTYISIRPVGFEFEFQVSHPDVPMWCAIALANLAASYCDSENDGRCYYHWNANNKLELTEEYGKVTSDGHVVRQAILNDFPLIQYLIDLSCLTNAMDPLDEGFVSAANAHIDRDEDLISIVPWAALGVMKNLVLEKGAQILLEPALGCICHASTSGDWFEVEKALHILERMRQEYPCHFTKKYDEHDELLGHTVCIDAEFFQDDGIKCCDYEQEDPPTKEQCNSVDRRGVTARSACCACGGGFIVEDAQGQGDFFYDEL